MRRLVLLSGVAPHLARAWDGAVALQSLLVADGGWMSGGTGGTRASAGEEGVGLGMH